VDPFPPTCLDSLRLFSDYLRVTGVAHLGPEPSGDPALIGKRLGLINGSSWITMWSNYFGRMYLPGVHLINMGNEAVQMNFMESYSKGLSCPPQSNIEAFVRYACDLAELAHVPAVMITCSTMNRAFPIVAAALSQYKIPLVQIDRPLMERAVTHGGPVLVIATHGPTMKSTQALLHETAAEMGQKIEVSGLMVEEAWERLSVGDIKGHNEVLALEMRRALERDRFACAVLAQLSMSIFVFSFPDPIAEFGIPVFTSGQCGFEKVSQTLKEIPNRIYDSR
jgi:hypothetical protein